MSFSDTPVLRPISNKRKPEPEEQQTTEVQPPYNHYNNNNFYDFGAGEGNSNNNKFFYDSTQIQQFQQNSDNNFGFSNQRNYRFFHYNRSFQSDSPTLSRSPTARNQQQNHQELTNEKCYAQPRPHPNFYSNARKGFSYQTKRPLLNNTTPPSSRRYFNGYNDDRRTRENNDDYQSNFNTSPKSIWRGTEISNDKNSNSPGTEAKELKILRHSPLPASAKISPKKIIEKITKFNKESLKHIINNPTKYDQIFHNYQREQALEEEQNKQIPTTITKRNDIDEDKGTFEIVPDDIVELPTNFWDCVPISTNEKQKPKILKEFWDFVLNEKNEEQPNFKNFLDIGSDDAVLVVDDVEEANELQESNQAQNFEETKKGEQFEQCKQPKNPEHSEICEQPKNTEQTKKPEQSEISKWLRNTDQFGISEQPTNRETFMKPKQSKKSNQSEYSEQSRKNKKPEHSKNIKQYKKPVKPENPKQNKKLQETEKSTHTKKPEMLKKLSKPKTDQFSNSPIGKERTPKTDLMSRIKAAESFKSGHAKKPERKETPKESANRASISLKPRSKSKSSNNDKLRKEKEKPSNEHIESSDVQKTSVVHNVPDFLIIQSHHPNDSTVISLEGLNSPNKQESKNTNSTPYSPSMAENCASEGSKERNKQESKNTDLTHYSPSVTENCASPSMAENCASEGSRERKMKSSLSLVNHKNRSRRNSRDEENAAESNTESPSVTTDHLKKPALSLVTSSSSSSSSSSGSSTSSASSSRSNSSCSNTRKQNSTAQHRQLINQKQEIQQLINIFESVILTKLPSGLKSRYKHQYSTCFDAKLLFICRTCTNNNYNKHKFSRSQIQKIKRDLKLPNKKNAIKILMTEVVNMVNKQPTEKADTAKRKKPFKESAIEAELDSAATNIESLEQADNPISQKYDIKVQQNNNYEDEPKQTEVVRQNKNDNLTEKNLTADLTAALTDTSLQQPCEAIQKIDNDIYAMKSVQNVPTPILTHNFPNYQNFQNFATILPQNLPGTWLTGIHDIDNRIGDLVKRKEFIAEMIAKLKKDDMELDMQIVHLQKEKFMLLNAALAANTTQATNTTNNAPNPTEPSNSNLTKLKRNNQNTKATVKISKSKKTMKRNYQGTLSTTTKSKASKLAKSKTSKSTNSLKSALIKSNVSNVLAIEERPNLSDKENEANISMDNVVTDSLEVINPNAFDYSQMPNGSLNGIESAVFQICIHKDCIIGATEDGHLYLFNMSTQQLVEKSKKHDTTITQMIFDEKRLALFTTSLDGYFKQTSLKDIQSVEKSAHLEEQIQSLDMQWDLAFIGTRSGNIFKCDIAKTEFSPKPLCIGDSSIMAIKATKEGPRKIIIISSKGNVILFRDAMTGLLLRTMKVTDNLCIYGFLFDESHLYCGTQRQPILKFEFTSCALISTFYCGNGIAAMRLYKNKFLIVVCYDGNIYFLNKFTGEIILKLPASGRLPLTLEIFGNKLLTSSKDKKIEIIDIPLQIVNE